MGTHFEEKNSDYIPDLLDIVDNEYYMCCFGT